MDKRRNWIVLVFCLNVISLFGQDPILISYSPSQIIKHSKKLTYDIPSYSYLIQASYLHRASNRNGWQNYWRRPIIGVSSIFVHFGDKQVLGNAYAILPSLGFDILRSKYLHFNMQLGTGLAYIDKPFHKITNPLNNAIGSHFNNVSQWRFSIHAKINQHFDGHVGVHLTHFSNARTKTPNSGINLGGLSLGFVFHDWSSKTKYKVDLPKDTLPTFKKWGSDLILGYGLSSYSFTGGSNYSSYFVNLGIYHAFSPYLRFHLGGEYEYNQSVFQFYYQDFVEKNIAKQLATNTAIYGAGEFDFGKISIRLQSGVYLPYPTFSERVKPNYYKLGINFRPFPSSWATSPYVGVLLKSHASVAQYLGLVIGCRI